MVVSCPKCRGDVLEIFNCHEFVEWDGEGTPPTYGKITTSFGIQLGNCEEIVNKAEFYVFPCKCGEEIVLSSMQIADARKTDNERSAEREIARKQEITKARIEMSCSVRESLPMPWVHYPKYYGAFHAFSEERDSQPFICKCTIPLIQNYLALRHRDKIARNSNPLRMAALSAIDFPAHIAEMSMRKNFRFEHDLRFREQLCHRCNQKTPSLQYCAPMYGTAFVQNYGWYINQAYLRFGIDRRNFTALAVCSDRFSVLLQRYQALKLERDGEAPEGLKKRQLYYARWPRNRELARARREITRSVEDETRADFGFKNVGEGWVSESILAAIVCRLYDGKKVIRHYRPDWLEGLELDIYLPELKLAYEYQGQQHFHPVALWGGVEACENLKKRDKRKIMLCGKAGICLVHISFKDPLTEEFVMEQTTAKK